eukprot:NODE_623_length_5327_cov_0.695103.p2 type:complete len:163 gc:universal NODE_623_length_5327_cov_0.695103:4799-4311(-)
MAQQQQQFLYYFSPFQDERMNRMLRQTMEPPRRKPVCELSCSHCLNYLCSRAMKAVLLADNHVELYSTDQPPKNSSLIGDDYTTQKCACQIKDVACLRCGNICGYHVSQPCRRCMESCNNGHFYMFSTNGVIANERFDLKGSLITWTPTNEFKEAESEDSDR